MTNVDEGDAELLRDLERLGEDNAQRRDAFANTVDALADGFYELAVQGWEPGPRAPGSEDQDAEPLSFGNRSESVRDLIKYETNVNILSAADQLRGFAVLLRAESSLMGAVTVARGIFESCLWASALIDSTISTEERVQRALTRRLARLDAAIRLSKLLPGATPPPSAFTDDDRHGSAREPNGEIAAILALARARAWKVISGRRAPSIGTRLSTDWIAESLEVSLGIEPYTWASGSSMAHGEHAPQTAIWVESSAASAATHSWLILLWSTGVLVGPRMFLVSFERYTHRIVLADEYHHLERLFRQPEES